MNANIERPTETGFTLDLRCAYEELGFILEGRFTEFAKFEGRFTADLVIIAHWGEIRVENIFEFCNRSPDREKSTFVVEKYTFDPKNINLHDIQDDEDDEAPRYYCKTLTKYWLSKPEFVEFIKQRARIMAGMANYYFFEHR